MRCVVAAAAIAAAVTTTAPRAEDWEATPGPDSHVFVDVHKRGLFSAFAHDHHFEVTDWHATASVPEQGLASTTVEVALSAASLRDRQERLSEEDRRKVDAQAAGREVLDAEHHPLIELRADRLEVEPGGEAGHLRGLLHGTLTLHGRSLPVDVRIEAERGTDGWRVQGRARLRQSAFGIRPFSGFGGTVGVKDEVEVELAMVLRPRSR